MSTKIVEIDKVIPDTLPVFPVVPKPIFPGIVMPIDLDVDAVNEKLEGHLESNSFLASLLVKDTNKSYDDIDNLYEIGTVIKIVKKMDISEGLVSLLIYSVKRFKVKKFVEKDGLMYAKVEFIEAAEDKPNAEIRAYQATIVDEIRSLAEQNKFFMERVKATIFNADTPEKVADFTAYLLDLTREEQQEILEIFDLIKRMRKVIEYLQKQQQINEIQQKIFSQINEKISAQQREFFLREQLKAIKKELGIENDEKTIEINKYKKLIKDLHLKGEVKEKVKEEFDKFISMDPHSSEYGVIRNWLDIVLALPWNKSSKESIDIKKASKILEKDHYGLEDIKKRILEFLAVRKMSPDVKGSILCLVGPPGCGKTSLGKSIARAMNREFFRFSLGGIRDEAEIKGHRKTYVGAMPGKIISSLKITKYNNPVIMLDEIDKLGKSYQGDPASALLEVLDPEQNDSFRDHYLEIPFDLSRVFFVTTANSLDTIPRPLLDRMEIIRLSGYIDEEKYQIGKKYLLPKQIKKHGIDKSDVKLKKSVFMYLINNYARQAGVRDLEKEIEKICRKLTTKKVVGEEFEPNLTKEVVRELLGPEKIREEDRVVVKKPGVTVGLAWTSYGGATLLIESIAIKNSKGFKLTGQLGDVMKESAQIAYSYVRSVLKKYGGEEKFFDKNEIHLHVPEGATPKDGPSAGITMASSLLSLALNKKIRPRVGMTGELTLTGKVLPIGGLREKVVAAKRAKLKEIIICEENRKDLEEINDYLKKGISFHIVENVDQVFDIIFNKPKHK